MREGNFGNLRVEVKLFFDNFLLFFQDFRNIDVQLSVESAL